MTVGCAGLDETAVSSKPAHQTVIYTEWHILDAVLIQLIPLMMGTWLPETCRENRNKHTRKRTCVKLIIHKDCNQMHRQQNIEKGTLDRPLCRTNFRRGCGFIARQIRQWTNEWIACHILSYFWECPQETTSTHLSTSMPLYFNRSVFIIITILESM